MDIGPPELIMLLVLIVVLFGGSQLPKLAKNLGKAQREFKAALEEGQNQATLDSSIPAHPNQDDRGSPPTAPPEAC